MPNSHYNMQQVAGPEDRAICVSITIRTVDCTAIGFESHQGVQGTRRGADFQRRITLVETRQSRLGGRHSRNEIRDLARESAVRSNVQYPGPCQTDRTVYLENNAR